MAKNHDYSKTLTIFVSSQTQDEKKFNAICTFWVSKTKAARHELNGKETNMRRGFLKWETKPNWNVIRNMTTICLTRPEFAIVQKFLSLLIFHLFVIYVPLRNAWFKSQVYKWEYFFVGMWRWRWKELKRSFQRSRHGPIKDENFACWCHFSYFNSLFS